MRDGGGGTWGTSWISREENKEGGGGDVLAEGVLSKLNVCFSKEDPDTCRTEQGAAGDVGGGGVSEGLEEDEGG